MPSLLQTLIFVAKSLLLFKDWQNINSLLGKFWPESSLSYILAYSRKNAIWNILGLSMAGSTLQQRQGNFKAVFLPFWSPSVYNCRTIKPTHISALKLYDSWKIREIIHPSLNNAHTQSQNVFDKNFDDTMQDFFFFNPLTMSGKELFNWRTLRCNLAFTGS